jgi:hypothetical protein
MHLPPHTDSGRLPQPGAGRIGAVLVFEHAFHHVDLFTASMRVGKAGSASRGFYYYHLFIFVLMQQLVAEAVVHLMPVALLGLDCQSRVVVSLKLV